MYLAAQNYGYGNIMPRPWLNLRYNSAYSRILDNKNQILGLKYKKKLFFSFLSHNQSETAT